MHTLDDAERKELDVRLLREVILIYGELAPESLDETHLCTLLQEMDAINKSRIHHVSNMADYLYMGIRPLLVRQGLLKAGEEFEQAVETRDLGEVLVEHEQLRLNTEQALHHREEDPLEEVVSGDIELPHAIRGADYHAAIPVENYIEGPVFDATCEGISAVRGLSFSKTDNSISGIPTELGSYKLGLTFIAGGMTRKRIGLKLHVVPDQKALPQEILLPSANVGVTYHAAISLDRTDKHHFSLDPRSSPGFELDTDSLSLSGKPEEEGRHELWLNFKWIGMPVETTDCVALVVEVKSDSRRYWKKLDPDPNSRYAKALHTHSMSTGDSQWRIMAASVRGAAHAHQGMHRHDDYAINYSKENDWLIMAVGAGADHAEYGRKGAELACKVAEQVVNKRITDGSQAILDSLYEVSSPPSRCPQRIF